MEKETKKPWEQPAYAPFALLGIVLLFGLLIGAIGTYAGNLLYASATVTANPSTTWINFNTTNVNQITSQSASVYNLAVHAGDSFITNVSITNSANRPYTGHLNLTFDNTGQNFTGNEILVTSLWYNDSAGNFDAAPGSCALNAVSYLDGYSCIISVSVPAGSSEVYGADGNVAFNYSGTDLEMSGALVP